MRFLQSPNLYNAVTGVYDLNICFVFAIILIKSSWCKANVTQMVSNNMLRRKGHDAIIGFNENKVIDPLKPSSSPH